MSTAILQRLLYRPDGTFGQLSTGNFTCFTLELPWKDNERNVSCIPAGDYECDWGKSRRFKGRYELKSVLERSNILIHPGNWAGDKSAGYKSDVEGCILLGKEIGIDREGQWMLHRSKFSVRHFAEELEKKPFTLSIFS